MRPICYLNGEKITTDNILETRAFLYGDAVVVYFFVRNKQFFLFEESYFFLMSSMRKMKMKIPSSFTLDFFLDLLQKSVLDFNNAQITFVVFRNKDDHFSYKTPISYYSKTEETADIFAIKPNIEIDLIKEITVNTGFLNNILIHCPENIFAEIYAKENDLDDVILLNYNKRIARNIHGNFLMLENETIKTPKLSEGAYISVLTHSFLEFVQKQNIFKVELSEIIAFETQKADEILLISDHKGLQSVSKLRNKTFGQQKFYTIVEDWKSSF